MFSGIVKGIGRILERADTGGDQRLTIGVKNIALPELHPGNSIAVNGVCLTATVCDSESFMSDVSVETLSTTTLGNLTEGDSVNLENALRLGDSLDGHLMTGHVDGVGRIESVEEAARSIMLRIQVDGMLAPYIARKGSVAVDGVSLTVNAVKNATFQVNIVPHTREMTVIAGYRPGTAVNIEVDIVARYLERLV
jgi:riboflavin synthase